MIIRNYRFGNFEKDIEYFNNNDNIQLDLEDIEFYSTKKKDGLYLEKVKATVLFYSNVKNQLEIIETREYYFEFVVKKSFFSKFIIKYIRLLDVNEIPKRLSIH